MKQTLREIHDLNKITLGGKYEIQLSFQVLIQATLQLIRGEDQQGYPETN